jgi:hypothetical protein
MKTNTADFMALSIKYLNIATAIADKMKPTPEVIDLRKRLFQCEDSLNKFRRCEEMEEEE